MTAANVLVDKGVAFHKAGRAREALDLYRTAIEQAPGDAEAHRLAALAELALGNDEGALADARAAAAIAPDRASVHAALGDIWRAKGRPDEALDAYRRAVECDETHVEARNNLALILRDLGHPEEALDELHHAIVQAPERPSLHLNLGSVCMRLGRAEEAERAFAEAVRLNPNSAVALTSHASAAYGAGHHDSARASLEKAVALAPDFADAHTLLGLVLQEQGQTDAAVAAHHAALDRDPDRAGIHVNLGNAYRAQARLDEAIAAYRAAIALDPDQGAAWSHLGTCLRDRGEHAGALEAFERALSIHPHHTGAHTRLMAVKLADGLHTPEQVFAEHKVFETRHARPAYAALAPFANSPEPERKLRLGILLCDGRAGAERAAAPLIADHDANGFSVTVYTDGPKHPGWRRVAGLDDARLAETIRADAIDVLVAVRAHAGRGRLMSLAYKPAPVVASLDDLTTTGLGTVDALFADPYLAPAGGAERFTERLIRLPSLLTFAEPDGLSAPMDPPGLDGGPATFGAFVDPARVTEPMVRAWAQILKQVPDSRLSLKYFAAYDNPGTRQRLGETFARFGIDPGRIGTGGADDTRAGHLAHYHQIDIALDTAPRNAATAAREALWMGVPVVTVAGRTMAGRRTAEVLRLIGLDDLIAETGEGYVARAVELAQDSDRRRSLRHTLRDRMRASRLMDAERHVEEMHRALRAAWAVWCAERTRRGRRR